MSDITITTENIKYNIETENIVYSIALEKVYDATIGNDGIFDDTFDDTFE